MGITIGDKHTNDFNLYVTDFSISAPEVQTYTVQVPGRNGLLDLTEVNGDVAYNNRTITIECTRKDTDPHDYHKINSDLMALYHGKRCNIIFDAEKDYYYSGRLSLSSTKADQMHSTYTITADCDPYAYEAQDRGERWIWDSFNFYTGVVYQSDYYNIEIDGSRTITISHNGQMPVPVGIELVSGNVTATFKNVEYQISAGINYIPEITIAATSSHFIVLKGTGTVNIHYRGGKL